MTVRVHPLSVLLASVVAALSIWLLAWCQLPGPQPAPPTVFPVVVVQPSPTTYVFVSPPPAATTVPELILATPTHAPTSTPIPTQTALPTPTVAPSRSPVQRG